MSIKEKILQYAIQKGSPFSFAELMLHLSQETPITQTTVRQYLYKLLSEQYLQKKGWGLYEIGKKKRYKFIYKSTPEEKEIRKNIKYKFPFVDFCIWMPRVLEPFMHHIPNVSDIIFIDVESTAIESLFNFIQEEYPTKRVLYDPSEEECNRYLYGDNIIVVRLLVTQSPLLKEETFYIPKIEKILVDILIDPTLQFAIGSEMYNIYENIFNKYEINIKTLTRYSRRRGKKEKIEEIIKSI